MADQTKAPGASPPDLSGSKMAFASQMASLAGRGLKLAQELDELTASYSGSVHGFDVQANGVNAFKDGDLTGSMAYLTPTDVADIMFALGTVQGALSLGVRNSLRKAVFGGLP